MNRDYGILETIRGCTMHRLDGEHGMSCHPILAGHSDGPTKTKDTLTPGLALGAGLKPWVFWSMVTIAVISMVYGFWLGNPFETYHNGSTL